jgi:hypothetical protein
MRCHQHGESQRPAATSSRRAVVAGLACSAVVPAVALAQRDAPESAEDVRFMRMAIEEARLGDFPFGR